ncbi:kinesin-like protein KIF28P [Callorhinchus milii]|uniref:kinesin-like protein KIF28P n=1 Tax=Callorhinchus milii TaxID=7868 RepID=UPI001C3FAD3A|nr:kinesin-like protein KIF28P [Callorhinchus milii]
MLEIYNEKVIDLLSKTKQLGGLKVRENHQRGYYVEGLKSVPCESYERIKLLLEQGNRKRSTASTNMNTISSRSHMIITIQFKQVFLKEHLTKQSDISLVDLAGSERQKSSGSEGDHLREGAAINRSLSTLGNVISALAEIAVGKKVMHVPYRDSTITKLLQSALGGNSKTIMIATISPADICYEETLSTLRYAERAKNIQNKAMINQGPSERLIQELEAETTKLLLKLSKIGNSGQRVEEETKELRRLLADNELQMHDIQTSWEQRLEKARKEWEQQYVVISQEQDMIRIFPYLLNVNVDPQLSGIVKHLIQDGETVIGHSSSFPKSITIKGLGMCFSYSISDKHATITNQDSTVTLESCGQAKVTVNGILVLTKVHLRHLDRVILGSSSTYLYVGFPSERSSEDLTRYDYDFFQCELAAAEGFDKDVLGGVSGNHREADPSVLAVFHDYIRVKPMVMEANQISHELNKELKFELEVKNLALTDSRGRDLTKEIIVKVTNKVADQVWVWSKAKFVNRKFIMEDMYQRFVDGESIAVGRENDPFWDPVEPVHLGTAHVWLQSLIYCIALEEQVEFHNSQGKEEAILQMSLVPCTPTGQPHGEDGILIDPTELVGQRMDFQVQITNCLGVKWLKQNSKRGIQISYHVINHQRPFPTKSVWNSVNPRIDHMLQFTVKSVSQELLNYLQDHAMVVDLWGLQDGCAEMASSLEGAEITEEGSIIIDYPTVNPPGNSSLEVSENQLPELYTKLSKLEQKIELLKDVNKTLRKENVALKETLRKIISEGTRPELNLTYQKSLPSNRTQQITMSKDFGFKSVPKPSYDVEFAKALKLFYQSMNRVRSQLLELQRHRPTDEDNVEILQISIDEQSQMIKDFGDHLESCINTLKNDVAFIIKKKREHSWCSSATK